MKKAYLLLVCVLLCGLMAAGAVCETLPDPGPFIGCEGTQIAAGYAIEGVRYDMYMYLPEKAPETAVRGVLTPYVWALEDRGFTCVLADEGAGGEAGSVDDVYVIADDVQAAMFMLEGRDQDSWCDVTLLVPEGMPFARWMLAEPANDAQAAGDAAAQGTAASGSAAGGVRFQDAFRQYGITDGSAFGGLRFQDAFRQYGITDAVTDEPIRFQEAFEQYGITEETNPDVGGIARCDACEGSGSCGTCGGDHIWYNPYTGDPIACEQCGTDGRCTVCDGLGH